MYRPQDKTWVYIIWGPPRAREVDVRPLQATSASVTALALAVEDIHYDFMRRITANEPTSLAERHRTRRLTRTSLIASGVPRTSRCRVLLRPQ